MEILVLGQRFESGAWINWEHTCDEGELEAVIDSSNAIAEDQKQPKTSYTHYLAGAAYIFDIAFGLRENPREGDRRVYAVVVDGMLMGRGEDIKRHLQQRSITA